MALIQIQAPRINANDDIVQLVEVSKKMGERVNIGDLICTVESSKAAVEIRAEDEGTIKEYFFALNDMIEVGSSIFAIETT